MARQINLNRQLIGVEDLAIGLGTQTQTRGGQEVEITEINVGSLPFNETQSLLEFAQSTNLQALGESVETLNNLNNNLSALLAVNNNESNINTIANIDTEITTLSLNISKIQEIYAKLTTIDIVNENIDSINIVANLNTEIETLYNNIVSIQTVDNSIANINTISSNINNINTIVSQIIPNLDEILTVDTLASQVSQDAIDVAAIKVAVEAIYDSFDDRYLGSYAVDPTIDNDGNPLTDGAIYFNTSSNELKVYDLDNTTWLTIPHMTLATLNDVALTSISIGDVLKWTGTEWANTTDLGTKSFDSVQLNGGTGTQGTLFWNTSDKTVEVIQGDVTLQLGQEIQYMARNATGSTIGNGTFLGFSGVTVGSNRIEVSPFDATTMDAHLLVGFATENIPNGVNGKVTGFGYVRELDTRGDTASNMAVGDETWAVGDLLYVHPTVNGKLTTTAPTSGLKAAVGVITNRHETQGEIFVRVTALDENAYTTTSYVDTAVSVHTDRVDNPHAVTKAQVGLENVDNTADSVKNVASAAKWTTARTLSLTGDVTGSVSIDGSGNVSMAATVIDDSHNHTIANVDGLQAALDSIGTEADFEGALI